MIIHANKIPEDRFDYSVLIDMNKLKNIAYSKSDEIDEEDKTDARDLYKALKKATVNENNSIQLGHLYHVDIFDDVTIPMNAPLTVTIDAFVDLFE